MQCLAGAGADLPHARTLSVKTLPSQVASGKCAAADCVLTTASCILYPAVSALPRPSHRRRRKICLRAFIQNCLKFRFHQMQHVDCRLQIVDTQGCNVTSNLTISSLKPSSTETESINCNLCLLSPDYFQHRVGIVDNLDTCFDRGSFIQSRGLFKFSFYHDYYRN